MTPDEPDETRLRPERVLEHLEWVRRLARGLVADPNQADDLAQEAWVAALSRPWPAGGGPARAWLARVVENAAKRFGRREGVRRGYEGDAARDEGLPSTEEILRRASLQRRLVDAVLELREPYRGTLLLRYFEGLAPEVIARRERVPVATVKTQLRRGLALLRERLDQEHGDRGAWLLALTPVVRPRVPPLVPNGGPLGAAGTGALIVSSKMIVGATAAAGVAVVAGVWWASRGGAPDAQAGAAAGGSEVELAATAGSRPAGAPPREVTLVAGERIEVEPLAEPVADPPAADPPAREPHTPEIEPSALERALDEVLATFRTDVPRVEELRTVLAELGRSAAVAPDSVAVDEHGVVRGSLELPIAGIRGTFHRGKDAWNVELMLGAAPEDATRDFFGRAIYTSIPDDLVECQTVVQHHPDARRDLSGLFAHEQELTVGWRVATSANAVTRLDPVVMTPGPDGKGVTIGRPLDGPVQVQPQERPWVTDNDCYQPWVDLLRPYVR